jgi:biopolymer transport protein ExbB
MSARRLYTLMIVALLAGACPLVAVAGEVAVAPVEPKKPLEIRNAEPATPIAGRAVEIIVYGDGFDDGGQPVKVLVGQVECTDVQVQSPRRLRASIPAGTTEPGYIALTVTNPDGESATLESALLAVAADGGFSWRVTLFQMRQDWRRFGEWFEFGGPLMYVLALISFFGVAWAIHCLLVLRRSQFLPRRFMEGLSSRLMQGDIKGATRDCSRARCAFAKVVLAGLRKAAQPPEKIRDAMTAAGSRESAHLQQKISYLANVGTISPMLGLLGTVFGMIMAFNIISSGEVRHYMLAAAIAQAMVTTATGLVIGIPAMAVYFYLRGRLLRLITDMEVVADDVAGTIIEKGERA